MMFKSSIDIPPIFIPIYLIICSVVVIVNGYFTLAVEGTLNVEKYIHHLKQENCANVF